VSFEEGAAGYRRLRELLGSPADCLIAMEATGHYWENLFASLDAEGFQIVLLNPLRTRRFAEEELQRTKTDKVDAVSIARFAAQKRPTATALHGSAIEELKQLVRLREQSVQHLGDRVRHLHKAIDLTFPEFTRHVRGLDTELATAILLRYPTAKALRTVSVQKLARLCYDGRRGIGDDLARALIEAAKISVGHFSSEPYQLQVRYALRRYSLPPHKSPRTRDRHRAPTQHARGWKAAHNNSGRKHTNRRQNNRRDRRSGSIPQRCGIRELYRRCSSASSVREEAIFRQTRYSIR
jgi:hypothetical protein